MSKTTKITIDIDKIAKLANMSPSPALKKKLESQLEATLEHIKSLEDIDTSHIVGTNEVTNLANVTREDVVTPSLTQHEALMNAKNTYNGFFVVDAVLQGE